MALANFGNGSVFSTSSFVSQARRACKYAKANLVHVRGVVGVGIDHDLDSVLFCQPQMAVIKIQTIGIGIQFHGHLLCCAAAFSTASMSKA